ncbi:MAG: DUF962 domain-containing protein [Myxococcales bacterium]|nr:DUF962 domain-containing protein [Myxococcales bacterium]MCB9732665.1 DUF962 domain-containing protein [Deltaproteobacteria bacterium]
MLDKLKKLRDGGKNEGTTLAVLGMAGLLTGRKAAALTAFGRGVALLEKAWRAEHPEHEGGLEARLAAALAFYEETHGDATNRKLHLIGIPMIVGGAAGLLLAPAFRPVWAASAAAFTAGWALNILGHAKYEKNKPAFADDPLAFLVGPLWDLKQVMADRKAKATPAGPTLQAA